MSLFREPNRNVDAFSDMPPTLGLDPETYELLLNQHKTKYETYNLLITLTKKITKETTLLWKSANIIRTALYSIRPDLKNITPQKERCSTIFKMAQDIWMSSKDQLKQQQLIYGLVGTSTWNHDTTTEASYFFTPLSKDRLWLDVLFLNEEIESLDKSTRQLKEEHLKAGNISVIMALALYQAMPCLRYMTIGEQIAKILEMVSK